MTVMIRNQPQTDPSAAVIAAAKAMAPLVRQKALDGERLGTLVPELVQAFRDARFFGMYTPKSLGGLELDPLTMLRVIETISAADGSAGWLSAAAIGAGGLLAYLKPSVVREMLAGRNQLAIAGAASGNGSTILGPDGQLTITGRWNFNSGCRHADWMFSGVIVSDEDGAPRKNYDRGPNWRMAFYPASEAEILDTWDVAGLRGTGSNDIALHGVKVPEEYTTNPFMGCEYHDGPWWITPYFTGAAMQGLGVPLGIARGAIDELVVLATEKSRMIGGNEKLASDVDVQISLGKAEALLESARAFAVDAIGDAWRTACSGDAPSLAQRHRVQLAAQQAMRAGIEAVDTVFHMAGGGTLSSKHHLQRAFRDIHAFRQHLFYNADVWRRYSRGVFNIDQPTYNI